MSWLLDNVTNIYQLLAIIAGTGITLAGLIVLTVKYIDVE